MAKAKAKAKEKADSSAKKPNILVIWGDDIGISNLSCYTRGLMGYQTPNIDRLAKEGMMFTDSLRRAIVHRRALVVHHRARASLARASPRSAFPQRRSA